MTPPRRFTVVESREAMLVTADNLDEVAAWCGGEVQSPHVPGVLFRVDGINHLAHVGSCLVTDGRRWWDVDADEFERQSAGWEEET